MSEIFESFQRKLVFPIDFVSQRALSKKVPKLLAAGAFVASLCGYMTQSLTNLLVCYGMCILVTLAIVLPPYESYNKHKLEWVQPKIVQ